MLLKKQVLWVCLLLALSACAMFQKPAPEPAGHLIAKMGEYCNALNPSDPVVGPVAGYVVERDLCFNGDCLAELSRNGMTSLEVDAVNGTNGMTMGDWLKPGAYYRLSLAEPGDPRCSDFDGYRKGLSGTGLNFRGKCVATETIPGLSYRYHLTKIGDSLGQQFKGYMAGRRGMRLIDRETGESVGDSWSTLYAIDDDKLFLMAWCDADGYSRKEGSYLVSRTEAVSPDKRYKYPVTELNLVRKDKAYSSRLGLELGPPNFLKQIYRMCRGLEDKDGLVLSGPTELGPDTAGFRCHPKPA